MGIPEEIPRSLEVVEFFRKTDDFPPIVEQANKLKVMVGGFFVDKMPLGFVNEYTAKVARSSDLVLVMDKYLMIEHHHLT